MQRVGHSSRQHWLQGEQLVVESDRSAQLRRILHVESSTRRQCGRAMRLVTNDDDASLQRLAAGQQVACNVRRDLWRLQ